MTWEISHSPIAWTQVRINLRTWTTGELVQALSDCLYEAFEQHCEGKLLAVKCAQAERKLGLLGKDTLVEECVRMIEFHNSCSNGGHEFYIDRQGYHSVPVSLVEGWEQYASGEEQDAVSVWG